MRVRDLQSADSFCHRFLVATKSGAYVRRIESESIGSTNLIVHQSITNIFHQIVELLRILGVLEESGEILLSHHRVHSLTDLFQFPGNFCASDSTLGLRV